MTEKEKKVIAAQAIKDGFYGSIWGSGHCDKVGFIDFENLEIVNYSQQYGGGIAGIGLPSVYSSEGYTTIWYFDKYGETWALTKNEVEKC